jgi:hypothetical protein
VRESLLSCHVTFGLQSIGQAFLSA